MVRGLAFVQFLIIGLGVFVLHLLGKLASPVEAAGFVSSLAHWLGRYGLWMIPVPILWAIFGNMLAGRLGPKIIDAAGLALTLALFLIFAVPLFWHLA